MIMGAAVALLLAALSQVDRAFLVRQKSVVGVFFTASGFSRWDVYPGVRNTRFVHTCGFLGIFTGFVDND